MVLQTSSSWKNINVLFHCPGSVKIGLLFLKSFLELPYLLYSGYCDSTALV